jgi:hypothetical protein
MLQWLCFALACSVISTSAASHNGSEALNHYGLTLLQNDTIGTRLMGRFKAKGQPVFLIHDPNLGLTQGDIMRFHDKAVLIDADVWQTLQDEGALGALKVTPLVRVQAKASVSTWESRAKLVVSVREKKAYQLGAELLKILEETFGGIPAREQMAIIFDGPNLVLLAPDEFLGQLKYSTVRRVPADGTPNFVSEAPGKFFTDRPFYWQAWAADPSEPAGTLRYTLFGDIPKSLIWDPVTHSLAGTPDLEGQWRVLIEARNKSNLFDTMAFNLVIRRNAEPSLAHAPKPVAVAGQLWSFQAEAVDLDHEGSQIKITAPQLPLGMEYDSITRKFQWYPSVDRAGEETTLGLQLEDPEGAKAETTFVIKIIPPTDMLWSEGIKPTLPWDTLQQGKAYTWEAGASAIAWAQQGIALTAVSGTDSTVFEKGRLRLRPMAAGNLVLTFTFTVQGTPMEQAVEIPVRPDQGPHFVSETGVWCISTGQPASYRPIAIDAEGDPIIMNADPIGDSQVQWDGERVMLKPEFPGTYAVHLIATDPVGHVDAQWIAYQVEKAERPVAWFLENNLEGGLSTWNITADFGTGRMGIFTADLDRIGILGPSGQTHWPYLVFGGNLLGRNNEKHGRRLWVDAGMTMRFPSAKVATGGIFGRLLGEWTFPGQALGKVEFEMQGHVNQAIVVADTSNLHFIYGDAILEFAQKYSTVVSGIIEEATARDNMVLFSRLEAWSRLGAGFWIGPGIWREEMPNSHHYYQNLGGGLRYEARLGQALAMHSLRIGWGSGGSGWTAHWSGRISYNSPF